MIIFVAPTWQLVITFVLAVVLPLLVGIVTKVETRPGVRTVWLAGFSAFTGVLTELLSALEMEQTFDLAAALLTWGTVFIIAVASHFGVWKPTGVADKAQEALGGAKHRAD